ncbi:hypothetical protein ACFZB2_08230 [Streptomyces bobili]
MPEPVRSGHRPIDTATALVASVVGMSPGTGHADALPSNPKPPEN